MFESELKQLWRLYTLSCSDKDYRPTKARDFEGEGGPEDKAASYAEANPGNDDVGSNVRQTKEPKGDPVPAAGIGKAHSAMDSAV